jgi:hypothetical protein
MTFGSYRKYNFTLNDKVIVKEIKGKIIITLIKSTIKHMLQ